MHPYVTAAALLALASAAASAQQMGDSTRTDSTARADSIAISDSIRIVRELEAMSAGARSDTTASPASRARSTGPVNPRLLPDISAVGDMVGDLTSHGSTQEDGSRFSVREVEVALQAAVDPYFRGDIFLGINDLEKISIEQAYLTATALPGAFEARAGRFLMPVGKQNTTHRHDLHTVEYPWVIRSFLGDEGLAGTGIWVSRIFAPLGFYQEIQAAVVDRFGEDAEGVDTPEPVNKELSGLGYSARLRNYWDLSEASNIELSGSVITGKRAQALVCGSGDLPCTHDGEDVTGVAARQTVVAADFTYRWRPLQQGLYKSFILQAEWLRQINEDDPRIPGDLAASGARYAGPRGSRSGFYTFARYQLTRRLYVGARVDHLGAPTRDDGTGGSLNAQSAYLEFFPSEFSKLMAMFERTTQSGAQLAFPDLGPSRHANRILLQATFAIGPHKPHPF
ncbi:MAG TPA: hypothetical protein VFT57_15540 [Gemmatimonadaceae bacterium]|nr:hypothetical protein [Gemmatimonadaceae bacterium]